MWHNNEPVWATPEGTVPGEVWVTPCAVNRVDPWGNSTTENMVVFPCDLAKPEIEGGILYACDVAGQKFEPQRAFVVNQYGPNPGYLVLYSGTQKPRVGDYFTDGKPVVKAAMALNALRQQLIPDTTDIVPPTE